MQRLRQILWFGLFLLIIIGGFAACGRSEKSGEETVLKEDAGGLKEAQAEEPGKTKEEDERTEGDEPSVICVFVCGKVSSPGVYELPGESRVADAIRAAGGMTGEADEFFLNQAQLLTDGQKIYVPDKEEAQQMAGTGEDAVCGSQEQEKEQGKVNLNTASKEELMTLSGIGEARAQSILDYREEHGPFGSIEDIRQVEGIKDGIYNRIKDKITV